MTGETYTEQSGRWPLYECRTCGALVNSTDLHDKWHADHRMILHLLNLTKVQK